MNPNFIWGMDLPLDCLWQGCILKSVNDIVPIKYTRGTCLVIVMNLEIFCSQDETVPGLDEKYIANIKLDPEVVLLLQLLIKLNMFRQFWSKRT